LFTVVDRVWDDGWRFVHGQMGVNSDRAVFFSFLE
jgi:hypothetical protein